MKQRGIFITTYFSYKDALIQAYTLPYVRILRKIIPPEYPVYLFTIEKGSAAQRISKEDVAALQAEGITPISVAYTTFGFGLLRWIPVLLRCLLIVRSKRIGTVHAWCTPGGVIGYLLSVFGGKPLVLDSFEPHAEVMAETGTWSRRSLKFKLLLHFEKAMARHASVHICCTKDMADYVERTYGMTLRNYHIKPACVNGSDYPEYLRKDAGMLEKEGLTGKIVCVYAGKFGGLYLKQEVFDFFRVAFLHWGDRFRVLLLSSEHTENIRNWSAAAGLPQHLIHHRFVPHEHIPRYLALADFALAPYQPVPSRKHGAPIKISEYWASGLPVVITKNIAEDSKLIELHDAGAVWDTPSPEAYRNSIATIDRLLEENKKLNTYYRIRKMAAELRDFELAASIYRAVYK